ncbi:hypothetical protein V5F59_13495 [Xanthobacter autotrophicus DSM 431]|uniref:hypothetical protein n=1 Tax=Xanthobacter nonsaccharivorans TaxID=3119912 RepID=UPI00372B3B3D
MAVTAQEGARIITDAVAAAAVAREEAAGAAAGATVGKDFCSLWPKAKPLLEVASTVLVFIPGAGTIAGPVLTGLIKIGDQIFAETCKGG